MKNVLFCTGHFASLDKSPDRLYNAFSLAVRTHVRYICGPLCALLTAQCTLHSIIGHEAFCNPRLSRLVALVASVVYFFSVRLPWTKYIVLNYASVGEHFLAHTPTNRHLLNIAAFHFVLCFVNNKKKMLDLALHVLLIPVRDERRWSKMQCFGQITDPRTVRSTSLNTDIKLCLWAAPSTHSHKIQFTHNWAVISCGYLISGHTETKFVIQIAWYVIANARECDSTRCLIDLIQWQNANENVNC